MKAKKAKALIGLALGLFVAVVGTINSNDLILIAGLGVVAIEGWDLI